MLRWAICIAVAVCQVSAQSPAPWIAARNRHFEVYAQEDEKTARSGLLWLEQLRAFVIQETGLNPDGPDAVRAIVFRSAREYAPYRLHSLSDAYYVGSDHRHYLVLPALEGDTFGIAAHEYAHYLFQLAGLNLPPWLREGMAEVFSSVRVSERGGSIGGDLPARVQLLRRSAWEPLDRVLSRSDDFTLSDLRGGVSLFYSQSWALTEMLALSPEYRPGFRALVMAISSGVPSGPALTRVYGKPLERISADLHARVARQRARPLALPDIGAAASGSLTAPATVAPVPFFAVRAMLAEALLLAQETGRAEELYGELQREQADNAEVLAGLGSIALARGDSATAQRLWKRAVDLGLADADMSYRYALLLDRAGQSLDQRRAALERVVRLRPDFEDAHFRLALVEENAGRHASALAQLDAVRPGTSAHAYAYWCARAEALLGLGRNGEAADAAQKAVESAANSEERANALQFARMARTHMAVQFTRDANGQFIAFTTRAPNDAADWNAFVEPGDDLRRVEGTLREIECAASGLRLRVDTRSGAVTVSIPDPSHVLMRNAPAEFVCGPQAPSAVTVEYAAGKDKVSGSDGIARGIEFRK